MNAHDDPGCDPGPDIYDDEDGTATGARSVVRLVTSEERNDSPPLMRAAVWADRVTPAQTSWFTSSPPNRRWLLRDNRTALSSGVLPLGKVGLLIGEGGVSKTMALIALVIAVATGESWIGCYDVETQGRALAILGEEDVEEVQRRCFYSARATRTNPPPVDSIVTIPLSGVPCSMIEVDDRGNPLDAPFLVWLRGYVAEHGPFTLIVVDPLSRFAGVDAEIDNAAATRFVQALESIATESGATIIVAHHTTKASRSNGATVNGASARGSSAIYDGVRWAAALSAERVETAEPRADLAELVTLTVVKSNYSRRGDPVTLRRDSENGGALIPVTAAEYGIIATARQEADPGTRKRAEREADREAKTARDAAQDEQRAAARADDRAARAARAAAESQQRAATSAVKDAIRRETEDRALLACIVFNDGISEARVIATMRILLGTCADRSARTAIERARLAGWLDVRTGPKGAKGHHLTRAMS